MSTFQDHVIVVTGASEGIGRALCISLAPQKPKLVLAARNKDRLQELKSEVEAKGAQALVVPTDVTDESACERLIENTLAECTGGLMGKTAVLWGKVLYRKIKL
jgi:NADP-dependent 3-hydroxy acid dehydrogenase YdfG